MPAYNAAAYLADAVASVQGQTFTDWELLILDDASSDETAEIAKVLAATDVRIRYHRLGEPLRKPASVRNAGLAMAKGQYVAFLDADDLYLPNTLALFKAHFEKNPSHRAVYGQYVEMDAAGNITADGYVCYPILPTWKSILTTKTHHQLQALALEKSLMLELGGFDERILFGEDWAFYLLLFQWLQSNLGMIKEPVFRYRLYANSISRDAKRSREVMLGMEDLCRWTANEAGVPPSERRFVSRFIAANYAYFFKIRCQQGQWDILAEAALRSFFNLNLTTFDWLRCLWSVVKLKFFPALCKVDVSVGLEPLQAAPATT